MTDSQFPAPQPGDSDDVVLALETARVLFISGEAEEAVRRLRRAAEAAEQSGDDLRAVALARAAADLTTAAEEAHPAPAAQRSLPPPRAQGTSGANAGRPSSVPRQAGRSSMPPPLPPSARRPATSEAKVEPAESTAAAKASPSSPPPAQAPAAPVSISPRGLSVRSPAASAGDERAKPVESKRPPKPEEPKRTSVSAAARDRAPSVAAAGDRAPKAGAASPDLANALRVAVKPSSRDERLLMMRLLGAGEEPGPGYRPALVVMLEPGGNSSPKAK